MSGSTRHKVLGIAVKDSNSYILDCGDKIVNVDPRCNTATVLHNYVVKSTDSVSEMALEPIQNNLVSISRDDAVEIYDTRFTQKAIWSDKVHSISNAGWSSLGKEFGVYDDLGPILYDVKCGLPQNKRRLGEPRRLRGVEMRGQMWCPWQSSILFHVKKGAQIGGPRPTSTGASHDLAITTVITAYNTAR